MNHDNHITISHITPAGPISVTVRGGKITGLDWNAAPTLPREQMADGTAAECLRQIDAYFAGRQTGFDLPLAPEGTEFQQAVWAELLKIPYGATASYSEIARAIGRPRACRAVAQACHVNPIAIIIPCHRVIGANGRLTGYAAGLGIKQLLLDLERGIRQDLYDL